MVTTKIEACIFSSPVFRIVKENVKKKFGGWVDMLSDDFGLFDGCGLFDGFADEVYPDPIPPPQSDRLTTLRISDLEDEDLTMELPPPMQSIPPSLEIIPSPSPQVRALLKLVPKERDSRVEEIRNLIRKTEIQVCPCLPRGERPSQSHYTVCHFPFSKILPIHYILRITGGKYRCKHCQRGDEDGFMGTLLHFFSVHVFYE